MTNKNKIIWEYSNTHKTYTSVLYEIETGLLKSVTVGTVTKEGMDKLLNFLEEYSNKNNSKIKYLKDHTKLTKMEPTARPIMKKFTSKDGPIGKLAMYGNNFFMRCVINLFSSIVSNNVPIGSFETEEKAINWLKK